MWVISESEYMSKDFLGAEHTPWLKAAINYTAATAVLTAFGVPLGLRVDLLIAGFATAKSGQLQPTHAR